MLSDAQQGTAYGRSLKNLLSVINVSPSGSFAWYGWTISEVQPGFRGVLEVDETRAFLAKAVSRHLYHRFYCTGQPVRQTAKGSPLKGGGSARFVDMLAAENSGVGFHDRGWRKINGAHVDPPGNHVWVEKGGLKVLAEPEALIHEAQSAVDSGAEAVSVLSPKEFMRLSPGYYLARGNTPFPNSDRMRLSRFYWNLEADGAATFVRTVTGELNRMSIPFIAKLISDPRAYGRHDSAVLYIDPEDMQTASESLRIIAKEMRSYSNNGTPALTLPLGPGFAFAEDPGSGQSFGMNRCGMIAEALVRAAENNVDGVAERYGILEEVFEQGGVAIDRPYQYKESDKVDMSLLLSLREARLLGRKHGSDCRPDPLTDNDLLRAATAIGDQIVNEAIWYGDRCSWLGSEPDIAHLGSNETAEGADSTYVALGSEPYHGASGVAHFLAELFVESQEERFRNVAVGAIRHSLSRIGDLSVSPAIGLYTGWPGLLATSAYVALLVEDEALLAEIADLVKTNQLADLSSAEFDLVSGSAGGVVAFLILDKLLGGGGIENALRLGEHVLAGEHSDGEISSWKSPMFPDRVNLLGLSHGAAGVGFALIELAHASGDSEPARAAQRAFNYENKYFSNAEQNWPDFRDKLGSKEWKRDGYLNFMTSWCHGAPGIALSRIHAYRRLGLEALAAEAATALNTTARILDNSFEAGNGNFSLCHGWCGNADILLSGTRSKINDRAHWEAENGYLDIVQTVTRIGIERYLHRNRSLPLGVSGGLSPGLMLGLAGVGLFYLRVRSSTLASVLLPVPEDWHGRALRNGT